MLCPSGMYLTVVLVLVLAVALVSAGADTYDCNHWGYFQQFISIPVACGGLRRAAAPQRRFEMVLRGGLRAQVDSRRRPRLSGADAGRDLSVVRCDINGALLLCSPETALRRVTADAPTNC